MIDEAKWTVDELQEYLDIELSRVVDAAKARAGLDAVTFSGTVSGFLIKTGLALAVHGGAPRNVVENAMSASIADAYGPRHGMNRAARRMAEAEDKKRRRS
jgi:hypothetical protein